MDVVQYPRHLLGHLSLDVEKMTCHMAAKNHLYREEEHISDLGDMVDNSGGAGKDAGTEEAQ